MDGGDSDYLVPVNYANYKMVPFMYILPHIFSVLVWLTLHFFGQSLEFKLALEVYEEKTMATHSSTLAWKIPWTEEPGRLRSMGSLGVRHD